VISYLNGERFIVGAPKSGFNLSRQGRGKISLPKVSINLWRLCFEPRKNINRPPENGRGGRGHRGPPLGVWGSKNQRGKRAKLYKTFGD